MIWILFFTRWELLAQVRPWVQTGFKSAALERTTFFVKRNSDMDTREGKRYNNKRERGKKKKGQVTTNCQQRVWAKMRSESVLTLIESWKKPVYVSCSVVHTIECYDFFVRSRSCVCVCVVCGWSLYDCSSEIEWEWKFVCERKRENVCVCVCVRCHEQTTVYLFHFKILSLEISCLCFFLSLHTKIVLSGWRSALGLGETALVSAHFPPLGALNLRLGESILKFHKRIEKKKNSLVRLLKYKYRNKLRINSKQTNYNSEHE